MKKMMVDEEKVGMRLIRKWNPATQLSPLNEEGGASFCLAYYLLPL